MDNAKVILRLKKTIIYVDKILDNFPKNEMVLKQRQILYINTCVWNLEKSS